MTKQKPKGGVTESKIGVAKSKGCVTEIKNGVTKSTIGVAGLVGLLVLVVGGGILFMGAVSGWFDHSKVVIDGEYNCEEDCDNFIDINAEEYEKLINEKKSFVLLVDQNGCTTADRVRDFMKNWTLENKKRVNRIMFS